MATLFARRSPSVGAEVHRPRPARSPAVRRDPASAFDHRSELLAGRPGPGRRQALRPQSFVPVGRCQAGGRTSGARRPARRGLTDQGARRGGLYCHDGRTPGKPTRVRRWLSASATSLRAGGLCRRPGARLPAERIVDALIAACNAPATGASRSWPRTDGRSRCRPFSESAAGPLADRVRLLRAHRFLRLGDQGGCGSGRRADARWAARATRSGDRPSDRCVRAGCGVAVPGLRRRGPRRTTGGTLSVGRTKVDVDLSLSGLDSDGGGGSLLA